MKLPSLTEAQKSGLNKLELVVYEQLEREIRAKYFAKLVHNIERAKHYAVRRDCVCCVLVDPQEQDVSWVHIEALHEKHERWQVYVTIDGDGTPISVRDPRTNRTLEESR